ncbi:MAG: ATPase [Rhodocyclaceae bacterium]|nr:ATPase [Rhodocyclaceae bacterium]
MTNQQLASDIAKREVAETELLKRYAELTELNCRLHDAQAQLVQSEKLASIGQLAAGVAHEINNPIGYVLSNITTLGRYLTDIFSLFDAFEAVERTLPEADPQRAAIVALKQSLDFDFLKEDLPALLRESQEGATRVRQIVQDLKDFSRVDHSKEWMLADIHAGLDSTLNVVNNELKYKAEVVRDYGQLPSIHCIPSQLNQVFMNLLVNAAHAIETRGTITIRTEAPDADHISVSVSDTGSGIPADTCKRIFEPFFTTKPVGKGTGLGLSLSYGIVQKHHGEITVDSTVGAGTTFRVVLPVNPPEGEAVAEAAET